MKELFQEFFGIGFLSLYFVLRISKEQQRLRLPIPKSLVRIGQKVREIMGVHEDGDDGGGIRGTFLRFWYCLTLYLIGLKWGLIELFSRHRKFCIKEISRRAGDVVVVTGGTRGIGASVVKMFLQAHMHVIIGCRNPDDGTKLIAEIRKEGITWGSAEIISLDLTSLSSAREFASQVYSKNIPINILVNNAGIMFCPYACTKDGFESQFQVNYLGHFLITNLLLPRLVASGATSERFARIVNVSSCAHYGGRLNFDDLQMEKMYSRYNAYMSSKLCQVISSTHLQERLTRAGTKVSVLSCHPGMVRTDLYQHVQWFKALRFFVRLIFKTPEQGADVVAYSALSPEIEKEGGIFIANSGKWRPSSKVYNVQLQNRLWDMSAELVGMEG